MLVVHGSSTRVSRECIELRSDGSIGARWHCALPITTRAEVALVVIPLRESGRESQLTPVCSRTCQYYIIVHVLVCVDRVRGDAMRFRAIQKARADASCSSGDINTKVTDPSVAWVECLYLSGARQLARHCATITTRCGSYARPQWFRRARTHTCQVQAHGIINFARFLARRRRVSSCRQVSPSARGE